MLHLFKSRMKAASWWSPWSVTGSNNYSSSLAVSGCQGLLRVRLILLVINYIATVTTQQSDCHFTAEPFLVLLSSMPLDLSMYRYTIIHEYAVTSSLVPMKTSKAKSAGSPVQNALIFYFFLYILKKKNEVIVQQRWRPHSHRAVSPNPFLLLRR